MMASAWRGVAAGHKGEGRLLCAYIGDAIEANHGFTMTMGDNAEPRRELLRRMSCGRQM